MPTKENKRQAKGLVEALEFRVHRGPPVCDTEIHSLRDFLRQHEFSAASDYFSRLERIKDRVVARPSRGQQEKRNFGGEAAGSWMQLQSVYDHVILSTCHGGEFNTQRGRIKISHRFNESGRVDFVELKFLRSLEPSLNGALRKLVMIKDYQSRERNWLESEAFALHVLPQELVFICGDVFRYTRAEVLAWLINLGHWTVGDLVNDLRSNRINDSAPSSEGNPNQLGLEAILRDDVALPILEQAAALEARVELNNSESVIVRYTHK